MSQLRFSVPFAVAVFSAAGVAAAQAPNTWVDENAANAGLTVPHISRHAMGLGNDGNIYLLAGVLWDSLNTPTYSPACYAYNPGTHTVSTNVAWNTPSNFNAERAAFETVNNLVYVIGGTSGNTLPTSLDTWSFNMATQT